MTDNAVVIAALQCDYYHYAICYIGSVAVVVPLWLRHRFCVAVLSCKRGNSSVIYKMISIDLEDSVKENYAILQDVLTRIK